MKNGFLLLLLPALLLGSSSWAKKTDARVCRLNLEAPLVSLKGGFEPNRLSFKYEMIDSELHPGIGMDMDVFYNHRQVGYLIARGLDKHSAEFQWVEITSDRLQNKGLAKLIYTIVAKLLYDKYDVLLEASTATNSDSERIWRRLRRTGLVQKNRDRFSPNALKTNDVEALNKWFFAHAKPKSKS